MPVEFGMHSSRSISSLLCFGGNAACSDRLDLMSSVRSLRAVDPVQAAKNDQKKLRKALERAVKQERKEARKMQKLAQKSDRSLRKRGSSSNRIALLSTATMSDCSTTSDQEILAELWAMHSPSMDRASDEDMPAIDEEMADTTPMEFLFFMGSDDMNLVGYRRVRSNPRASRYTATPSFTTTVPIKSTLVSNMPPLFVPRF